MKDVKHWNDLHLKATRISFLSNYIIAGLAIIFIFLFINRFNLGFDLFPDSRGEMFSSLIIICLVFIPAFLIEQPEWIRFMRQYKITLNEVMKTEGIFTRKKIILPYQSVSEVTVHQTFFGRILNYGDLHVDAYGAGSGIHMTGIRNAHKIHELIQYRVNILREGQLGFFREKENEEHRDKSKNQETEGKKPRKKASQKKTNPGAF